MKHILLYFSIKYKGDWDKIYKALEEKEKVSLKDIQKVELDYKDKNWMTIIDTKFPKQFKQAYKPPFVFFWEGDINLLKKKGICASVYEIDDVKDVVNIKNNLKELTKNNILVNSLNSKGDVVLQRANSNLNRSNIIVSSNGLDVKLGEKNDLLITEIPEGSRGTKNTSNRLTAALSDSLILFNSNEKEHSNLVTNFLNLGKDIHCFPKEKENYNNELIKQGANIVTKIKDVTKDKELERMN